MSQRIVLIMYRMFVVRASMRAFTFSNINISQTSKSIATKYYMKYYLGRVVD